LGICVSPGSIEFGDFLFYPTEEGGHMKDDNNPLAHLSPRAQKIAQQKVMTSLTDDQIMDRHGLTKREYNKILKDDNFQEYMKQCQAQLHEEDFFKKLKAQEMYLRQAMFDEVLARFDAPDPERDLGPNHTMEERAAYLKRFAFFAEFKDLMRLWDNVDKRTRLNLGEATERVEQHELVGEIQEKYTRIVAKRKQRNEIIAEAKAIEASEVFRNGEVRQIEAELIIDSDSGNESEEILMEEYMITKKKR
jgi:hypothetical protein